MKANARFQPLLLVVLVTAFFSCASVASTNVKVMTYNVFEGTDFGPIIAVLTTPNANANDFQNAVQQTIGEVVSSNPGLRAYLIAQEIKNANPDLVGLQEAAVWTLTSPANPNGGFDLLQMILTYLALLGDPYTAVVTVPEFLQDCMCMGPEQGKYSVIRVDIVRSCYLEPCLPCA